MAFFAWSDSYSVGVQSIDDQHKKLIQLTDDLFSAMKTGKGNEQVGGIVSSLIDYTLTHFAYEEKAMQAANYPGYLQHHKLHEDLVKKVKEFQAKFQTGNTMLSVDLLNFLKTWLINHIQGDDKKYLPYLVAKGIK